MKTIQITMDEQLLARLDDDATVRQKGRSAVLREMAAEYLDRRKRKAISEQYHAAYGGERGAPRDLAGWENEGIWPKD